jgi:S-DNA-T family DNA segregation ATPase FtsK/SpoIIIE
VLAQQGSASLLQRELQIGFNRAGKLIDQLELVGVIGPFDGNNYRVVHFKDEISLKDYLNI